jgi:hypothetical protein
MAGVQWVQKEMGNEAKREQQEERGSKKGSKKGAKREQKRVKKENVKNPIAFQETCPRNQVGIKSDPIPKYIATRAQVTCLI